MEPPPLVLNSADPIASRRWSDEIGEIELGKKKDFWL